MEDNLFRCDNCGYTAPYDKLEIAKGLLARFFPGDIFSDVECPKCGSLCYPLLPNGVLRKPLSKEELKTYANKDGILTVRVAISLITLITNTRDNLNDWADEKILEEGCLSNISYKVVGVAPGIENSGGYFKGCIILQVTADVSELI